LAALAASKSRARTADAAALAAAEAYVQLAQARELAALLATSRDTVGRHVATARAYVEQGMLVRSELLRAEVELARLEDLLAEAQGGARLAETALSFRLGADLGETWELAPLPDAVLAPGEVAAWVAEGGSRADLAAAKEMVEAGKLEESVRRAAAMPRVGVVLRHDRYDDFPFGVNGGSSAVLAMAGIDLWNGGRHRAAADAARAEAEAGERDVERMERGIRLAVEQAWERLSTALARMATAARSLDAAREAERIVSERFRAGVVKTLDLLDATTARREAETREVVARADAHLAALKLVFEAGKAPEQALAGQRRGETP
jgi:outer membrane protein TolC